MLQFSSVAAFREYYFGSAGYESMLAKSGELKYGAAITFVYSLISRDPLTLSLGLGPGNVSESGLPGGTGHYARLYQGLGLDRNMISVTLGELGILGTALTGIFLGTLYFSSGQENKHPAFDVRSLFAVTLVLIGMLSLYHNPLRVPAVLIVLSLLFVAQSHTQETPVGQFATGDMVDAHGIQ